MSTTDFEQKLSEHESWDPVVTLTGPEGQKLFYSVPNHVALWRVQTFFTKEPFTVRWLDGLKEGAVFLDVGANVGMYTIYAAVMRRAKVYAFEPESQNYAILNKNIIANNLSGQVVAVCAALSDVARMSRLYLSEFSLGGSCHSFGDEVGFDLKQRKSPHAQGCLSVSIDDLVEKGDIEIPNYIKVDVDGFEHNVLRGAAKTLERPELRELIIEINPALEQHRDLISWLQQKGFVHDPIQALQATRKEGLFKGVGEYIFKRRNLGETRLTHLYQPVDSGFIDKTGNNQSTHKVAMQYVLNRIGEVPITENPFPHAVVDDVFPDSYYQEIQRHFPPPASMVPLPETGRTSGAYRERLCVLLEPEALSRLAEPHRSFWVGLTGWLYHPDFINRVTRIFWPYVENRLAILRGRDGSVRVRGDGLVVSDRTNYAIGPHTDSPHRLMSFLFYLPVDSSLKNYGTSLYQPKDPGFVCAGGPHHPFELFSRTSTLEFVPNRLFVFVKTERSFHGVEPIVQPDIDRRLLIYNVRLADV